METSQSNAEQQPTNIEPLVNDYEDNIHGNDGTKIYDHDELEVNSYASLALSKDQIDSTG